VEIVALLVALVALLVALATARGQRRALEEGVAEARRATRNAAEESRAAGEVQRRLLARIVAGDTLTPEMVLEGQLWRDVDDALGRRMLAEMPDLVILDVRTPQETRAGTLPGAMRIPIDELEARKDEISRGGRRLLVYCEGGARSAAACEYLCTEGYLGVHNLEGGYGAWTGPKETPRD